MTPEAKTPWSGRFTATPETAVQEFGASLSVDKRMWQEDIEGSMAHAKMLARVGVLTEEDAQLICDGLLQVGELIANDEFEWNVADEDVHMAIEKKLTEIIGQAGARLHTGRSRNDQVATDTRLYIKKRLHGLAKDLVDLRRVLISKADSSLDVVIPGYTHLQKAQPILLSHYFLAHEQMYSRDFVRIVHAYEATDVSPLGSAALAGTTYPLDREFTALELGFSAVSSNSLDAVSDRDFLLDTVYSCAVIQMHLSRLCEEIILWSTDEFGFITLDDSLSTGSSIMPQKKNPDFAELIRGKTGRVYGSLIQLLTVLKGLPLAYNKDMQEDKEGVFDALDTTSAGLRIMRMMIETMTINSDRMRKGTEGGYLAATDLADYLVGKGMPFRAAHEVVGRIILYCELHNKTLHDLTAEEYNAFDSLFDENVLDAIDIDTVVNRRNTFGGTARAQVQQQLLAADVSLLSDSELIARDFLA